MALCLAESLVETGRLDPADQLERYLRWYRHGHLSSTGACFDIGLTTRAALERFERAGEPHARPTAPDTAGNGSLMRLAPVPLFFAADVERASEAAGESSRTTHGAAAAVDACRYFGRLLALAVQGASKEDLLAPPQLELVPEVAAVANGSFRRDGVRGTGYVVESLEAALWAFARAESFREGALLAVNLGEDADTTGAVYGQLAGAFWGEDAIPAEWREPLALRATIEALADRLFRASGLAPEGAFWVESARLLAGRHVRSVRALEAAGVTLVVDLTHSDDGLGPYELRTARRLHVPVRDFDVPSVGELERALDAIDAELAHGGIVHVHCLGGCGRTGTVVAAWLVRQGLGADAALARFAELCGRDCPETDAQRELVRAYAARLGR